jgi:hypothetical protein
MKNQKVVSVLLLAVFLLGGISFIVSQCKPKTTTPGETSGTSAESTNQKPVAAPDFNADSAYAFVAKQVSFGPRIPGTSSQKKCADWLTSKLKSFTPHVVVQQLKVELWNHQSVPCTNIVASFNPEQKKRILLCSHWDTRPWSDQDSLNPKKPFDGADDGASGVGVLIELARVMSQQFPAVGVDLLLLDVEDYGPPEWDPASRNPEIQAYCLGTQEWASSPHVPDYRAYFGILLDMVGAKNARFLQEGASLQYAPSVVDKVWSVGNSLGYGNYFVYEKAPGIIDDHVYINRINATPTIDIINLDRSRRSGFAKHWHTQDDNMNIIDKKTLKAVGQTLLQVVFAESADAT